MAQEIKAQRQTMIRTADQITSAANQMVTMLGTMTKAAGELAGLTSGNAADAFQAEQLELDTAFAQLIAVMGEASAAIKDAAVQYDTLDQRCKQLLTL